MADEEEVSDVLGRLTQQDYLELADFTERVESGSLSLIRSPGGSVMFTYRRDGETYTLAKMPRLGLWFWGRRRQDLEAPLLAAESLPELERFIKVLEQKVAEGVARFQNATEELLSKMEESASPEAVVRANAQEGDPPHLAICTAGIARLTLERIRAARRETRH